MIFVLEWVVAVAVLGALAALADTARPIFALCLSVAALFAIRWWYGIDTIAYMREHPTDLIGYFLCWLVLGVFWSFFRWWRHLIEESASLKKNYPENWKEKDWRERKMPKALWNIDRLSGWILFWPLSMIAYVLSDPITKLVTHLATTYDRISRRVFDIA